MQDTQSVSVKVGAVVKVNPPPWKAHRGHPHPHGPWDGGVIERIDAGIAFVHCDRHGWHAARIEDVEAVQS